MSADRQLTDRIKGHFVRKSSAELRRIAEAVEPDRWSAEASMAASELLSDRLAGIAHEPVTAEEEPTPPSSGHDVNSLALIAGLNLLALPLGFMVLPRNATYKDDPIARDQPIPFGPDLAWLALSTTDTAGVAAALGLRESREATWADGIDGAYQSAVFVTPPLGQWTLAVSSALIPPTPAGAFVRSFIEPLSRQYRESQFFCTHSDAGLHGWARASRGRLLRGYMWSAREGRPYWEEGPPTREERTLWPEFAGAAKDEQSVLQIASYWSIDPTTLDEHYKEPVLGILGSGAWATAVPASA